MNPLDPAQDPDRFDPAAPAPALNPALDPDRFQDQTLPELLGEGAQEDNRDTWESIIGLAGILLFLAVVTAAIYLL